jgi:4-amino-4-deoxy-L-arabinose transferase-like glycosyltransferase
VSIAVRWPTIAHSVPALLCREFQPSARVMWLIFWLAAASFLPFLLLQYVGEEAVYTILAQELWAKQEFTVTTLYGVPYGRASAFAWLIMWLTRLVGDANILIAARSVAMASTLLMGLTLAWLVRRLFKDRLYAAFCAAVFLSGDVLFYRGWLAYADPCFSCFTFAAMACLWVATQERRNSLMLLAMLALMASFLAKALTGYVFYGGLALILLWRHENRTFLLSPFSLVVHVLAAVFPLFWDHQVAATSIMKDMTDQIADRLSNPDILNIPAVVWFLVSYPVRIVWHLLPISAIALYCLARGAFPLSSARKTPIEIGIWALLISVLPYWLTQSDSPRYLMPLYPLFAMIMTFVVYNSGKALQGIAAKALMATIGIAYIVSLVGFPLYERYVRGSYADAARMIIAQIGDEPIYAIDHSSTGLSIAANLNVLRAPAAPITRPPPDFASGYVLALRPDIDIGETDLSFEVGRNRNGQRTRYLLCRGAACSHPR